MGESEKKASKEGRKCMSLSQQLSAPDGSWPQCVCVCLSVLYHIWVHSSHGVCVTALCMWRVLCVRVKCICSSFMVVSVDFCYPALLRQCLALTWWNMSAPWGIPSVCWVAVKQLCTCAFMHFSDSVLQKRARQYTIKWSGTSALRRWISLKWVFIDEMELDIIAFLLTSIHSTYLRLIWFIIYT